ncbi:hypothetical protein BDV38DRAFT_280728 [Aspergillus pseudotamarii]|uniref:F-box domain-containing protein n=1 Tax=Aspergillus pseudotamarii TaxID=132259 RepID=A0A5N6SYV2_ASPPS|nr:uncharacterized protein BDV38DRAFT_280728 [Aspergillus pseudotamarii]KAE8139812.1 hypothetical protein BDV38DRAFT_280728 [Aspergillus pseudotamarii]
MQSLTSLPTEILHQIVRCADPHSLKALRQVCRSLGEIGKERLFESITIYATEESCDRFIDFLENEDRDWLQSVTKVYLDLSAFEGLYVYDKYNDETRDDPKEKEFRKFVRLFPRLKELPRLQSVVLRFHPECGEDEDTDVPHPLGLRSAVMKEFLSAITALPQLPRELAIRDLHNVNESNPDDVENTKKVLRNLRSLRLNITNPHNSGNSESDLYHDDIHTFFSALPSFWLRPALQNLEHLTIYSSHYFGYYPKLDLRDVHFPRLKTLALGNYAFVHDSQLDWILSHRDTLTELYLDDCAILWVVATRDKERTYLDPDSYTTHPGAVGKNYAIYAKRWRHYFKSFQGLRHLRHFRYGHSEYWWDRDDSTPFERETEIIIGMHEDSYLTFDSDWYSRRLLYHYGTGRQMKCVDEGPLPWIEEDQTSLEELLAKIGQKYVIDEATADQIDCARVLRQPRP